MKSLELKKLVGVLLVGCLMTGCSVGVGDVRANEGRTASAEIEQIVIPYNDAKSTAVLIVEPFVASQRVVTWTNKQGGGVPIGDSMAAQLVTALSNVGNFHLYDHRSASNVQVPPNGKGPYLLRATLTELNEDAESEASSRGGSLGGVGVLTGIAGAVTGNRGLGWAGYGVGVANPTYRRSKARRTGVVAFDLQIVEKNTGRIVASFESSGTFTSESEAAGASLFGIGGANAAQASSALGQALRAAMNDTVRKSVDTLLN